MCNRRRVIFLACLLLAAEQKIAQATPVTFTTTTPINQTFNSPASVSIDVVPLIDDADELISISGGSVTGVESGSFEIIGVFDSGPSEAIATIANNHTTVQLSTVTNETFPSGNLTRITFQQDNPIGSISIPAGTVFTFDALAVTAVPEPSTVALFGTGLLVTGAISRRRRIQTTASLASGT